MKRVLFFGTYDVDRHPRVKVLQEGFQDLGWMVEECNVPLGDTAEDRVALLSRPWRVPLAALRVARAWTSLSRRARRTPPPDVVVVGYLGHFDIRLADRLWPNRPLVLDQLAFAADTALDRRAHSRLLIDLLVRLGREAVAAADLVLVDTEAARQLMPDGSAPKTVVVPVGAPTAWFRPPRRHHVGPMRVIFFGLYTPPQGTPVIGRALDLLSVEPIEFTMIGRGQDYGATRSFARANPKVTWLDWVDPSELPALVAEHDVCLGVFGIGSKGSRVVPNKVYQGAAAGCAVVTSDTPAQRDALGDAAVFVEPGDAAALASALSRLAGDPGLLWEARSAAYARAERSFRPGLVVAPLIEVLGRLQTARHPIRGSQPQQRILQQP